MTVKALTPVRTVNLVAPLAHKATDMHITDTAAPVQTWSGAATHLIAVPDSIGLRAGSLNSAMVPLTPGIATSTTATRTTTTRATKVVLLPSA